MNADYVQMSLRMPEGVRVANGREARAMAGGLIDRHIENDRKPDPLLWHRQANGESVTDSPAVVRWHTNRDNNLIGIDGVGPGADVLRQYGHTVTRAFAREHNTAFEERWRTGECAIVERPYALYYRVPMLLLTRSHRSASRQRDLFTYAGDELERAIIASIERGITRQCDVLGLDVPALDIRLGSWQGEDGAPRLIRPWPQRKKDYALAVHSVRIETNVELAGPWHAGYLQSHGYGAVLRQRHAAASRRAA